MLTQQNTRFCASCSGYKGEYNTVVISEGKHRAKETKTLTQVKGKPGEIGPLEASAGGSLKKELVSDVAERETWGDN